MEKEFQTVSVERIGRWVFNGLSTDEIMGLPRSSVRFPSACVGAVCCGQPVAIPLGVAAGPHTQLAQNIVSAWLCGARFIELKTVQILDDISVSRPCIDSADLTYNCEWSQELSLDQSFEEYIKAWVLIHALAHKLEQAPGMIFNMSVGYDLKGIQSEKVQRFIARMRNAEKEMPRVIDAVATVAPWVRDIEIPTQMTSLVTLSTMHGCPPAEIERIATFFLEELNIDTWVKLNPTLLGPELLRGILNRTMGHDVVVEDEAFAHDPKFDDAMKMVSNLLQVANKKGRNFGVKLTNTLEVSNRRTVFPPKEKSMYMSGRALHPLTVTLAHRVTEAQDGKVDISFCGGADAFNFPQLIADGVGPVTTCTDLLKPGGYARLAQYVDNLEEAMKNLGADSIESFIIKKGDGQNGKSARQVARETLARHAERVLGDRKWKKRIKPLETKSHLALGAFDCINAPCQVACPTHQSVPDYMRLVANKNPAGALDVIMHTNALPAVTGRACDHPCVQRCVRNHYDTPLAIRAIKRHAVEHGSKPMAQEPVTKRKVRVAVVGAGPMGLSTAYYLARAGSWVAVYESKQAPGGMASGVIPRYRLPDSAIELDISRVQQQGVHFEFGVRIGRDLTLAQLRSQGFDNIVLAVGAQQGRRLGIAGENAEGVYDALDFLESVRKNEMPKIGPSVLVVGGGNSAMDAARTAIRLVEKGGTVTVVYRRTLEQMPADPDEIEATMGDGVRLEPLRAPVRVQEKEGKITHLVCAHMELGPPDASGRPRPVPIEGKESAIACDTLIVGISQEPVLDFLGDEKPEMAKDATIVIDPDTCETSITGLFAGGDLARGPSSIIQAIADGRRVAKCICERENLSLEPSPSVPEGFTRKQLLERRSLRVLAEPVPEIGLQEGDGFHEVEASMTLDHAVSEADRCLACHTMCSLCVTVCPNRANQMYELLPFAMDLPVLTVQQGELTVHSIERFAVDQRYQVLNVADFCNECGNCTTFCPTSGRPFADKPRIHLNRIDYEKAWYDAYYMEKSADRVKVWAKIDGQEHHLDSGPGHVSYEGQGVKVRFDTEKLGSIEAEASSSLAEGTSVHLAIAAQMMVIAGATEAIPW